MAKFLIFYIMASNVSQAGSAPVNVSDDVLDCGCESGQAIEQLSYGGTVSAETVCVENQIDGKSVPVTTFKIKMTAYSKERLVIRRGISYDKAKVIAVEYVKHKRA